jgi:hypothetical protein
MRSNFFIAAAGASPALAGLVIVAVSVNINSILKFSHLPARAGAAIGSLILILVASMAALVPPPDAGWKFLCLAPVAGGRNFNQRGEAWPRPSSTTPSL